MTTRGRVRIGTSGWRYDHWRGPFYPEELPTGRWLNHYAQRFDAVEVNRTFYSLPDRSVLEGWAAGTPDGFMFAVKASRYLTHMKKLKDPDEPLANLLEVARGLGPKLGPLLFQLPPAWRADPGRLDAFLDAVPDDVRVAVETRDESWFDDRVLRVLADHGAAFCIWHLGGTLSPKEVTADLVYVRLHGPGDSYEGRYDRRTLAGWAGAVCSWRDAGRDVHCYFDNDQDGYAPVNARELAEMVGG